MPRSASAFVALCIFLGGPAGCRGSSSGGAQEQPERPTILPPASGAVASSETTVSAIPERLRPSGEIVGYLGIEGRCASTISTDGVRPIDGLPASCRRVFPGAAGDLFASTHDELLRVSATGVQAVPGVTSIDALAEAPDGSLWTSSHRGIGHHVESTWTFEPKTALGPQVRVLEDVAVTSDGEVYVAALDGVYRRDADAWTSLPVELSTKPSAVKPVLLFKQLHLGHDGRIYAVEDRRLFAVERGGLRQLDVPTQGVLNDLAVGPDGALYIRHRRNDIVIVGEEGDVEGQLSAQDGDFEGRSISDIEVDGRGRLWLSTEAGLYVFDRGGERRALWRTGSASGLRGSAKRIVLFGEGPMPLPPAESVQMASVRGLVRVGDPSHADIEVELCPAPSASSRFETPCTGSALAFRATTNDEGAFVFTEVPVATYGVAVKVADRWIVTRSAKYGEDMRPGERLDLGVIDVGQVGDPAQPQR